RMEKNGDDVRANLVSVRTGRASVHMLDQVKVDYYGTDTPVAQVAQVTTPEANLIVVQPWEILRGRGERKGHWGARKGLQPHARWKSDPHPDPADDRRPPQGGREETG